MIKGRIIEVHRTNYSVSTELGEFIATVRGNFHEAGDFPKVGDYVEMEPLDKEKAVIESVAERASVIKRKAADSDDEQIIATNVDKIFIVVGLDGDFSINRLERYLLLAKMSNIEAVIILNKVDVVEDVSEYVEQIESMSGDVPVLAVSASKGIGMEKLYEYLKPDTTAVLLGSSGAGKSTITNWLLQEDRQEVRVIREDDSKGRHTTTSRQLFSLPHGGYLIDTPGMRELGVLEANDDDEKLVFDKIESYGQKCKFRNCDHERSEGCAVMSAIEDGNITERELKNYHKILRERAFLEDKDSSAGKRHREQNLKRQSQKQAAILRERLSRR
jgi:ribosome biogenesis GTPase